MNLDQRLAETFRDLAEQVDPPEVTLDAIRTRAHNNRRRALATTAAAALLTLALAGIPLLPAGRDTTASPVAPGPPVSCPRPTCGTPPAAWTRRCTGSGRTNRASPAGPGLQGWMDDLPVGGPPLTPYWHDGVLHMRGARSKPPTPPW